MAVIRPATFYDWLMLLHEHRLKCGPLEAFDGERFHHAIGRFDRQSYGFWDHRTQTGYLEPDKVFVREVTPAPPVSDTDPEWR
jgi:hypothetical protein